VEVLGLGLAVVVIAEGAEVLVLGIELVVLGAELVLVLGAELLELELELEELVVEATPIGPVSVGVPVAAEVAEASAELAAPKSSFSFTNTVSMR